MERQELIYVINQDLDDMKNCQTILVFTIALILFVSGCQPSKKPLSEQELATAWAELALHITRYTPANSPTYASRCFGYIGLTMYESIVNGYSSHQSVAGQLNGLGPLPAPEPGQTYHWPASLNAAQAHILRSVYNQTSDQNKTKIDSLENSFHHYYSSEVDPSVVQRSEAYGRSVAEAIFEWSKTDGGHRGYLNNFDKDWKHPERPGSWKPPLYAQSFSHYPLHPHWGKNRTFVKANGELETPHMIEYDTSSSSEYYQQFIKVYEKEMELTQEEKEIAIWWGDDPDVTFTPPGHSYYLATVAIKTLQPELIKCAEAYARVGMAVADAFIACWKWKYHFFSERPNTFIPQFIDQDWESFWPDPPFPSFPSGHAIQAASAATVLEDVFNEPVSLIDSAHVGRPRDELRDTDFKQRSFDSFWAVAQETANSRFYGGIHTPQDNEVGLAGGKAVGQNVNGLNWYTIP